MILAFSFLKVSLEKKNPPKGGKISIMNNVSIKEAKAGKVQAGPASNNGLNVRFTYETDYQPDVASLKMEGSILYSGKDEEVIKAAELWKKDKKLPDNIKLELMNYIVEKCTVKALMLTDNFNLPPPINLPKVTLGEKKELQK